MSLKDLLRDRRGCVWLVGWFAGPPHLRGKAHFFEGGHSLCGMIHLDTRHHRALNPDVNQRALYCLKCHRTHQRLYWQRVVAEARISQENRHAG